MATFAEDLLLHHYNLSFSTFRHRTVPLFSRSFSPARLKLLPLLVRYLRSFLRVEFNLEESSGEV